ncbi:NB-ARC domain-containing protein [Corchorus olitorius]|uniref:NB-ARC domain-containing protein n=1 Tax=Corchorus olitorius TaxID=93759 RepID=A0A1R3HC97_9ROSI|nr:NB-ARC domain-containing protein [Corchorus olitorius]
MPTMATKIPRKKELLVHLLLVEKCQVVALPKPLGLKDMTDQIRYEIRTFLPFHMLHLNDLTILGKCNCILGKKAPEHATVVEKLLQAKFDTIGYRRASELIVKVPGDYYNFHSRNNLVGEIMNALTNVDVKVVGLHGLPGVRKTMLVNVVGKKASEEHFFDEVVIATVPQSPNIRDIQGAIAEQLDLRFHNVEKESGRAYQTNAEMKFECNVLSPGEAMVLFANIVGGYEVVNDPAYNTTANRLVEKCAGLLVAVSAIANALKNTSLDVWENALTQLRRSNPTIIDKINSMYSIIDLSYKSLKSEEAESLFELCAMGPASNIYLPCLVKYDMGMHLFEESSLI